ERSTRANGRPSIASRAASTTIAATGSADAAIAMRTRTGVCAAGARSIAARTFSESAGGGAIACGTGTSGSRLMCTSSLSPSPARERLANGFVRPVRALLRRFDARAEDRGGLAHGQPLHANEHVRRAVLLGQTLQRRVHDLGDLLG